MDRNSFIYISFLYLRKLLTIKRCLKMYKIYELWIDYLKVCKFWHARHLWPLSSEGSILCYTYCDTGHPFIMVISEDQWHSHLLPSVWQWSCHYLFLRHMSFAGGIRTPNLPLAGRTLQPTVPPPRLKYKLGTYENAIYRYINLKILDFFFHVLVF